MTKGSLWSLGRSRFLGDEDGWILRGWFADVAGICIYIYSNLKAENT